MYVAGIIYPIQYKSYHTLVSIAITRLHCETQTHATYCYIVHLNDSGSSILLYYECTVDDVCKRCKGDDDGYCRIVLETQMVAIPTDTT